MNVVFMGTPDFAAVSLRRLLLEGFSVSAVFCQPDRPKGRGYQLAPPPVKMLAQEHGIPVHQPKGFKKSGAAGLIRSYDPDVIVVVAYGRILPKEVLDIPPMGCINVHASLLPQYRGAGPIQWAVLNGEAETGVTTMYMAEGLDTGDMIFQAATPIGENETAAELHGRLAELGAQTLVCTLHAVGEGKAPRVPQDDSRATQAPMLDKGLCALDFSKPAPLVHNQIRGLNDWPVALTQVDGKPLKVYRSAIAGGKPGIEPGVLLDAKGFVVSCGDGTAVELLEVQPQGKKRVSGADFLRGRRLQPGAVIGGRLEAGI